MKYLQGTRRSDRQPHNVFSLLRYPVADAQGFAEGARLLAEVMQRKASIPDHLMLEADAVREFGNPARVSGFMSGLLSIFDGAVRSGAKLAKVSPITRELAALGTHQRMAFLASLSAPEARDFMTDLMRIATVLQSHKNLRLVAPQ